MEDEIKRIVNRTKRKEPDIWLCTLEKNLLLSILSSGNELIFSSRPEP